jgi:hypothetical protein
MTERVTFVELNICCQENGVFSDQAVCKPVPVRLANRYPVPIGERVQIDPSAERIEDAFSV